MVYWATVSKTCAKCARQVLKESKYRENTYCVFASSGIPKVAIGVWPRKDAGRFGAHRERSRQRLRKKRLRFVVMLRFWKT